jgi:hypothetical protein
MKMGKWVKNKFFRPNRRKIHPENNNIDRGEVKTDGVKSEQRCISKRIQNYILF